MDNYGWMLCTFYHGSGLMLVVMCVIDACWCWCIYPHRHQPTHAASASVSSFTPSAESSAGTTVVVLGGASCVGVRLRQGASPLAAAVWPRGFVLAIFGWASCCAWALGPGPPCALQSRLGAFLGCLRCRAAARVVFPSFRVWLRLWSLLQRLWVGGRGFGFCNLRWWWAYTFLYFVFIVVRPCCFVSSSTSSSCRPHSAL